MVSLPPQSSQSVENFLLDLVEEVGVGVDWGIVVPLRLLPGNHGGQEADVADGEAEDLVL